MAKRRLNEIAKELGRQPKDLLDELRPHGIEFKSIVVMVDEATETRIRELLSGSDRSFEPASAAPAGGSAGRSESGPVAAGTILRAAGPRATAPVSSSAATGTSTRSVYTASPGRVGPTAAAPARAAAASPAPPAADGSTPAAAASTPAAAKSASARRRFEPDEPARGATLPGGPAPAMASRERPSFSPDAGTEVPRGPGGERPRSSLPPLPPLPPRTPPASPTSHPASPPSSPAGPRYAGGYARPGVPGGVGGARRPGMPGSAPRPHRMGRQRISTRQERRARAEAQAREIEARSVSGLGGAGGEGEGEAVPAKPILRISQLTTIAELAGKLNVKTSDLIKKCLDLGVMVTINQRLDQELASVLVEDFGFAAEFVPLYGEEMADPSSEIHDDPADLVPRPPIVTVMGHVDHGKTTLLDAIRQTSVTETEHGGITQHIGAYKVAFQHAGKSAEIVFLDTPGHEAFTAMRARGAKVTDLVVLVVAADDGVQPQTLEAISHAKAAAVPILVAVNKVDKDGANPARVRQELSDHGLQPEEWGGKTIYCDVSAKKRTGLEHLLEMVLLQSEVMELKANAKRSAQGTVIEARMDRGRGPMATVLVEAGTLSVGDNLVCGLHYGKIRALLDDHGVRMERALPATPAEVLGLSGVPQPGDRFQVVTQDRLARHISQRRQELHRELAQVARKPVTLENFMDQVKTGDVKELKLIVKADVHGSAEALRETLVRLPSTQVRASVIHTGIGNISESDVLLASASNAVVLGFNVKVDPKAQDLADRTRVDIRTYNIIYQVVDSVRAAMEGLLEPEYKTVLIGRAEVRNQFKTPLGLIAGCYVLDGKIQRGADCRVVRGREQVHLGKVETLRRFKDDVKEVTSGFECGMGFKGWDGVAIGDLIEVTVQERVTAKLKEEVAS